TCTRQACCFIGKRFNQKTEWLDPCRTCRCNQHACGDRNGRTSCHEHRVLGACTCSDQCLYTNVATGYDFLFGQLDYINGFLEEEALATTIFKVFLVRIPCADFVSYIWILEV